MTIKGIARRLVAVHGPARAAHLAQGRAFRALGLAHERLGYRPHHHVTWHEVGKACERIWRRTVGVAL